MEFRHGILLAAVMACLAGLAASSAGNLTLDDLERDPTRTSFTAEEAETLFEEWIGKHNKVFPAYEYGRRLRAFADNLVRVGKLNAGEDQTDPMRAVYGMNLFADLTPEQFRAQKLMPKSVLGGDRMDLPTAGGRFGAWNADIPNSFDWRDHQPRVIGSVDDQMECGSTWAWSVVETISSMWALAGNALVKLSVQQVVDCDEQSYGCDGGEPASAAVYATRHGLESNATYPYTGMDGTCKYNQKDVVAQPSGSAIVSKNKNETVMAAFVATVGPISVDVDAVSLQYYKSGVVHNCARQLDHCMQLVGFQARNDTENGFWIARNQWTKAWGIEGYVWLAFGNNTCGVAEVPLAVHFGSATTSSTSTYTAGSSTSGSSSTSGGSGGRLPLGGYKDEDW